MSAAISSERSAARLVTSLLAVEAACARARAAAWFSNNVPDWGHTTRELRAQLAAVKAALDTALEEAAKEHAE